MSLPHFTNNIKSSLIEPIYANLFEIQYSTIDISKEECNILTESSFKIEKNILYFNVNENSNSSIQVLDILNRLNIFSLTVLIHNKQSNILGKFIYTDCEFINKLESMVDFDWNKNDILTPKFELKYKKLEYIDSKDFKNNNRSKKIERLIIEKPKI